MTLPECIHLCHEASPHILDVEVEGSVGVLSVSLLVASGTNKFVVEDQVKSVLAKHRPVGIIISVESRYETAEPVEKKLKLIRRKAPWGF